MLYRHILVVAIAAFAIYAVSLKNLGGQQVTESLSAHTIDNSILQDMELRLKRYPEISIAVEERRATLTGRVASEVEYQDATMRAMSIPKVVAVYNNLSIVTALDKQIIEQISTEVSRYFGANNFTINIKSNEGVVTLSGYAGNAAEKMIVLGVARAAENVSEVVDMILIKESSMKAGD